MGRRGVVMLWLVVFLAAAAYGWYGFYTTFQRISGSETPVPGRVDLDLDAGTYRIFVRNHIVNGSQCRPSSYIDDIESMGLRLRPRPGTPLVPVKTGTCDGGTQKGGRFKPASVSEFRVPRSGRYTLSAERSPTMTAFGKPARVYLTDSTNRMQKFALGLGGLLVGLLGAAAISSRGR